MIVIWDLRYWWLISLVTSVIANKVEENNVSNLIFEHYLSSTIPELLKVIIPMCDYNLRDTLPNYRDLIS